MENAIVILLIAVAILSGVTAFLHAKEKSKSEIIAQVKEQAYQLFLYAEKEDWIGPKKMDWAASELASRVPGKHLKQVIGEQQIRNWLQGIYDGFKSSLENK